MCCFGADAATAGGLLDETFRKFDDEKKGQLTSAQLRKALQDFVSPAEYSEARVVRCLRALGTKADGPFSLEDFYTVFDLFDRDVEREKRGESVRSPKSSKKTRGVNLAVPDQGSPSPSVKRELAIADGEAAPHALRAAAQDPESLVQARASLKDRRGRQKDLQEELEDLKAQLRESERQRASLEEHYRRAESRPELQRQMEPEAQRAAAMAPAHSSASGGDVLGEIFRRHAQGSDVLTRPGLEACAKEIFQEAATPEILEQALAGYPTGATLQAFFHFFEAMDKLASSE